MQREIRQLRQEVEQLKAQNADFDSKGNQPETTQESSSVQPTTAPKGEHSPGFEEAYSSAS